MFVLKITSINGSNNSDFNKVVNPSTGSNSSLLINALKAAMEELERIRANTQNDESSGTNYNQDANEARENFWSQIVQYIQGVLGIKNPSTATNNTPNDVGGDGTESGNSSQVASNSSTSKNEAAFTKQLGDPDVPDSKNGDCGPASLTMALAEQGVTLAGDADTRTEEARKLMGANPDETTWTNKEQIVEGAQKAGLNAVVVDKGSTSDIKGELQKGNSIVAHVNPKGYGGPDTSHFIVVSDIQGDPNDPNAKVTIKDPLDDKPKVITVAQLQASMSGNLVSIGKGNNANYA